MEGSIRNQGRMDLNTERSAGVALVGTSAALCIVAVCIYCIYCRRKINSANADQPPTTTVVLLPVSCYDRKMDVVGGRGCVICLSEFNDGEDVKVIPGCGHEFHSQCIDAWLAKQVSCPLCRCEKMSSIVECETEGGDEGERVCAIELEVKVMARVLNYPFMH